MKDKYARAAIEKLAAKVGLKHLDAINEFILVQPHEGLAELGDRIERIDDKEITLRCRVADLETELAAMKENARPICKTCGQKIQDGFLPGQVEQVAAAVRKADRGKK